MNKIATSIVGKLWGTILLLVSFVLFIFTVLMLEFLGNYHNELSERSLKKTAASIASVVDENNFTIETTEVVSKILAEEMNVIIAKSSSELLYTDQQGVNQIEIQQKILTNEKLRVVYTDDTPIFKEMILPSHTQSDKLDSYLVLAYPLPQADKHGAIFIYQNPEAVSAASRETTKIIFLAAAIALILTTVFAFFLSSRITYPLRKMREHAFELAKGKFDSKLPITQNDEIGQLAVAFNQMGRQLKHHLEVINQEKEQLSSVLTSMTDAVITFNRDRTILVSNPPAEILLQKWFVINGSYPIPPEIYHMLDHVLDFEDKIEEEIEISGAYFSVTISPLYNGSNVRGAVAVIRDKTEQNRLEKMRSDFIANVSHELRTPIAMLQGYSEAILDDVVSSEEERNEMIRIIYDESQRMGRLVTDLLDLARMSSGFMKLYKNEVDAVFALERMTSKFAQVAKEKQVELHFENLVGDFLRIEIDEDRIEQVITNLVDNAIRHTPAGKSVTVRIQKEQSYLRVDIEDTGVGIPTEDVPYVFERFYKADKARTRAKGGTGLGLAIAKNIVEVHEGNISVKSALGEGTTFTFYLPI